MHCGACRIQPTGNRKSSQRRGLSSESQRKRPSAPAFWSDNPVVLLFRRRQLDPNIRFRLSEVARDVRFSGPMEPFGVVVFERLVQSSGAARAVVLAGRRETQRFCYEGSRWCCPAQVALPTLNVRGGPDSLNENSWNQSWPQEHMRLCLSAPSENLALLLAVSSLGFSPTGGATHEGTVGVRLGLARPAPGHRVVCY